jgi:hypothetical protein
MSKGSVGSGCSSSIPGMAGVATQYATVGTLKNMYVSTLGSGVISLESHYLVYT